MSNPKQTSRVLLLSSAICLFCLTSVPAQQKSDDASSARKTSAETQADKNESDADVESRNDKFQKALTNTKFIGRFTVTGSENQPPKEEEYTITSVKKLPKGDYWEITARIKYGDHDVTVPMAMEIKWAGKTPVITVNQLLVPGLGTFDARVLLRKNKYAGTWAHDDVGGHLFGRIEKIAAQQDESTDEAKESDNTSLE